MKKGLKPIKYKDHRTYDFHRTFGIATDIPKEFNFNTLDIFPDQNADGLPNGCTAYATNDIASNEDKTNYDDQDFTYNNTKMMEDLVGDVPVSQMDALNSATVYGVKSKSENSNQALDHRRAPYFIVKKLNDSYFDGAVSAMWLKQGKLSVGTPWLPEFENVNSTGIIPDFTPPANFSEGHNWTADGVKILNDEPRIICKSWQGKNYGDDGYCYFTKKQFDSLLSVSGSGLFGQKHVNPQDIVRVKMTIIETIISYIRMLITKLLW